MPQRVRPPTPADDAEAVKAAADYLPQRRSAKCPERGSEREEERAFSARRPDLDNVAEDGLANASGQRIETRPARLGTAYAERLFLPVQIV